MPGFSFSKRDSFTGLPGGLVRFQKPRAHSEPMVDSPERTGRHQLVNRESDQAGKKQNKSGYGHREETARGEFFSHGAPPFARPQSNRTGGKLVGKRGRTRAALSSLVHRADHFRMLCRAFRPMARVMALPTNFSPHCHPFPLAAGFFTLQGRAKSNGRGFGPVCCLVVQECGQRL